MYARMVSPGTGVILPLYKNCENGAAPVGSKCNYGEAPIVVGERCTVGFAVTDI